MDLTPYLLVDPHGNMNNHDAMLIDRAVYRANAALYRLENKTPEKLTKIGKDIK